MGGHPLNSKTSLQVTLSWEDTLYTVKPVFKGHSWEDTIYTVKLVFKDTLMGGHPLYSKTCLQVTLSWEDTLYTVKPVFKGHSDGRTPSKQSNLSHGTLWWEDTLYTVKPVFRGHFDDLLVTSVFSERYPILCLLLWNLGWKATGYVGTLSQVNWGPMKTGFTISLSLISYNSRNRGEFSLF